MFTGPINTFWGRPCNETPSNLSLRWPKGFTRGPKIVPQARQVTFAPFVDGLSLRITFPTISIPSKPSLVVLQLTKVGLCRRQGFRTGWDWCDLRKEILAWSRPLTVAQPHSGIHCSRRLPWSLDCASLSVEPLSAWSPWPFWSIDCTIPRYKPYHMFGENEHSALRIICFKQFIYISHCFSYWST